MVVELILMAARHAEVALYPLRDVTSLHDHGNFIGNRHLGRTDSTHGLVSVFAVRFWYHAVTEIFLVPT
jgi:hypothetical protein